MPELTFLNLKNFLTMKVVIENIQGVYFINGKRLGRDILSEAEKVFLNEFIKELKRKDDDY